MRPLFCFLFLTGRIGVFRVVRKTRQLEQEEKSETVNRYIAVIRNRTKMLKQLMQFKYSGKSIPSSGVGILLSYKS